MNSVEFSVILPTRNGQRWIGEQLRALAAQEWEGAWEIVFVDNDSDDETPQILAGAVELMPVPAKVVRATAQRSLAYARNVGADAAEGSSIAFIDDDDVIAPGWVAAMGEALRDHEFVGSRFDYHKLNSASSAEARGSFQTRQLGEMFGVAVVSGGGSGVRRSLWEETGGNDAENFAGTGQDMDFALRIARLDRVTPVLSEAAQYHVRLRDGARSSFRQGRRFGNTAVKLFVFHGSALGAQPESAARVLRRWGGFALRWRQLLDPGQRLIWLWHLGVRVGRLQGSVRWRVWFL